MAKSRIQSNTSLMIFKDFHDTDPCCKLPQDQFAVFSNTTKKLNIINAKTGSVIYTSEDLHFRYHVLKLYGLSDGRIVFSCKNDETSYVFDRHKEEIIPIENGFFYHARSFSEIQKTPTNKLFYAASSIQLEQLASVTDEKVISRKFPFRIDSFVVLQNNYLVIAADIDLGKHEIHIYKIDENYQLIPQIENNRPFIYPSLLALDESHFIIFEYGIPACYCQLKSDGQINIIFDRDPYKKYREATKAKSQEKSSKTDKNNEEKERDFIEKEVQAFPNVSAYFLYLEINRTKKTTCWFVLDCKFDVLDSGLINEIARVQTVSSNQFAVITPNNPISLYTINTMIHALKNQWPLLQFIEDRNVLMIILDYVAGDIDFSPNSKESSPNVVKNSLVNGDAKPLNQQNKSPTGFQQGMETGMIFFRSVDHRSLHHSTVYIHRDPTQANKMKR